MIAQTAKKPNPIDIKIPTYGLYSLTGYPKAPYVSRLEKIAANTPKQINRIKAIIKIKFNSIMSVSPIFVFQIFV